MLSKVALVVAVAALALASYAVVAHRSRAERHRCGGLGAGNVTCVSNDTPRHIEGRSCAPVRRVEGVMRWLCSETKR